MWRVVLEAAIPFLLPFALYAFWLAALKRSGRHAARARPYPWIGLSAIGLSLAFAVLVITSNLDTMDRGERYQPARMENGRIVPGGGVPR